MNIPFHSKTVYLLRLTGQILTKNYQNSCLIENHRFSLWDGEHNIKRKQTISVLSWIFGSDAQPDP